MVTPSLYRSFDRSKLLKYFNYCPYGQHLYGQFIYLLYSLNLGVDARKKKGVLKNTPHAIKSKSKYSDSANHHQLKGLNNG